MRGPSLGGLSELAGLKGLIGGAEPSWLSEEGQSKVAVPRGAQIRMGRAKSSGPSGLRPSELRSSAMRPSGLGPSGLRLECQTKCDEAKLADAKWAEPGVPCQVG
jgi:hypothetical protein